MDVVRVAIASRILVFGLQVLFNSIIPDHDAQVFETIKAANGTVGDKLISFLLSGYSRWDAQYFLHIVVYGYTFENTLAFFPLYPYIVSFMTFIFKIFLGNLLNDFSITLLCGSVLNFVLFIGTSRYLYSLTLCVFKDSVIAKLSVLFFCINPASIFFSACYSETLFSFLTFSCLLCLERNHTLLASLLCGLSTATRSNGLISVPFIVHHELKYFIIKFKSDKNIFTNAITSLRCLFSLTIYLILAIAPFLLYQSYAYLLYCKDHQFNFNMPKIIEQQASLKEYKTYLAREKSGWCNSTIPLSYSFVQSYYWNVGFMKYYELKQIPNFILALPIVTLAASKIYYFLKLNFKRIIYLGLIESDKLSDKLFVYIIHLASLLIMCIFFIHIQVTTRLLASTSPVIYWFLAAEARKFVKKKKLSLQNISECAYSVLSLIKAKTSISFYLLNFVGYFIFGTALHVNFLPWT